MHRKEKVFQNVMCKKTYLSPVLWHLRLPDCGQWNIILLLQPKEGVCEMTDDSSYPPSILRKRPPVDQGVGEKRRAERRVRFREPEEVIEHVISCCDYVVADDRTSSGLPVLLGLSFCAVLILAVSLYYTSMKEDAKVLEEFQSRLVIFFLHLRHVAQRCWTWFMRQ
ncbi:nutritionally-regulated adipose and cardiac enriched protein homolog isoform X4 [Hirundo rustica]|uniref:nutritionally-regulated adipose and cardiac enriched protein homolog isoform X4 n=1 Tax=Hirundo rustica TaxID=43150 RepID=UPI001A94FCF9|nr:nutritionally-regulated adipose and cardiac enriched protein homolog isoform X4 [Hirundo rustica]